MISNREINKPFAIGFRLWIWLWLTMIFVAINILFFEDFNGTLFGLIVYYVLFMPIPYGLYGFITYEMGKEIKEIFYFDKSKADIRPPRPAPPKGMGGVPPFGSRPVRTK